LMMNCFPRGFSCVVRQTYFNLPPSLRVAAVPRPIQCLHSLRSTRNFSVSPIRRLAESKDFSGISKSTRNPTAPLRRPNHKPQAPQIFNPYKMVLGTKPILLYKASSQTYYAVVAYFAATAAGMSAAFVFDFYHGLPPELPTYVGLTYLLIGVILVGLSWWTYSAPVCLIRTIHAVAIPPGLTALRIEGRRLPLPGFKPIVMVVTKGEVFSNGMVQPQARMFEALRARNNQDLRRELERESIIFRPFIFTGRWIVRLVSRVFTNTKIILGRFGMIIVDIPGEGKWKLDTSGWVADGGKPIDQIITAVAPEHLISRK